MSAKTNSVLRHTRRSLFKDAADPKSVLTALLLALQLGPKLSTTPSWRISRSSWRHRGPASDLFGVPQQSFLLMWYSATPIMYESISGGLGSADRGLNTASFDTKQQALAQGKLLQKATPVVAAGVPGPSDADSRITYNLYRLFSNGTQNFEGSYPEDANAPGARVKFRERGKIDLYNMNNGVDDIWREYLLKSGWRPESWGEVDELWVKFVRDRIDFVDENDNPVDDNGFKDALRDFDSDSVEFVDDDGKPVDDNGFKDALQRAFDKGQ